MSNENIFLIGPMGSGKSSVGRQLARKKHLRFIDTDQEIIDRTGVEIGLIFEIEGEDGFRKREKDIVTELCQQEGLVLATGGGAVIDPDNRQTLASRGFVIYLKASPAQLLKRTGKDSNRPLLKTENREQTIRQLLADREGYYLEIADLVVDTDRKTVRKVVEEICRQQTQA